MGFAPLRRTRLFQPGGDGIDWSNPLTRGLVDVIDMSGTVPRSVILGTPATSFGTKPVSGARKAGRVTDTSAAFGGWLFQRSDGAYTPAGACSHVAVGEFISFSGVYAGLFATADGSGANNHSVLASNGSTGQANVGGTTAYVTAISNGLTGIEGGSPVVVIATFAPNKCNVWANNVNTVSNVDCGTLSAFSTSRLVLFGERGASSSYATKGRSALHLFYNRDLVQAERFKIVGNPWQVFL